MKTWGKNPKHISNQMLLLLDLTSEMGDSMDIMTQRLGMSLLSSKGLHFIPVQIIQRYSEEMAGRLKLLATTNVTLFIFVLIL